MKFCSECGNDTFETAPGIGLYCRICGSNKMEENKMRRYPKRRVFVGWTIRGILNSCWTVFNTLNICARVQKTRTEAQARYDEGLPYKNIRKVRITIEDITDEK